MAGWNEINSLDKNPISLSDGSVLVVVIVHISLPLMNAKKNFKVMFEPSSSHNISER